MEKRYQVFISSTFQDLQPARQEVSEALLRSDCFPAQMELWGAADAEQFEFIKQIIDMSDYFIVISAGKYGSLHPDTGISFTEMEYDYAQEKGIPTLRFVHADPFTSLTGEYIEQDAEKKEMLLAFHSKLKDGRLCKLWSDAQELGKEVILGLVDSKRRHPAIGWVRGDAALDVEEALDISRLRKRMEELETQNKALMKETSAKTEFEILEFLELPDAPHNLPSLNSLSQHPKFASYAGFKAHVILALFSGSFDNSQIRGAKFREYLEQGLPVTDAIFNAVKLALTKDKVIRESEHLSDYFELLLRKSEWRSWATDYLQKLEIQNELNGSVTPDTHDI